MTGVVDAPKVRAGDAEVGVAELALDHVQRHAFAGELDGVGVAQLVRREAPPDAGYTKRVPRSLSLSAGAARKRGGLHPGASVGREASLSLSRERRDFQPRRSWFIVGR